MTFDDVVQRTISLAAIALIGAACGLDSPAPGAATRGGDGQEGLTPTGVGDATDGLEDPGNLGGRLTDDGSRSSGGNQVPTSGGGSSTDAAGPGAPGLTTDGGATSSAPGVTDSTITLGLPVTEDIGSGNKALGAQAATSIDYRRAWGALVRDINNSGGIAGRKVRPVYHTESAVSSESFEQRSQEACADWTQDHRVFAALADYQTTNFVACMERAGAVVVSGTIAFAYYDERVFPRFPHYIVPIGIDLNTQATATIDGLYKQDYFEREARIGLITFDEPGFKYAVQESAIPALERHGLELTDIAYLKRPHSYGDYSEFSSEANNAAVRFKTEGITHVIILDWSANASFFFMQAAEKQAYRPRYGINTQAGNTFLAENLGDDAKNQLHGARSIGWAPIRDERPEDDPNSQANPDRRRCLNLMRKSGVEMTTRDAETDALRVCDEIWYTKAAIEAGGRAISSDSFLAGVARLGARYRPAITFRTRLSEKIHDGVGAVAHMSFFDSCTCFRYTSRPYAIPD